MVRTLPSLLSTILNKFDGLTANFIEVSHEFKWCLRYLCHLDDPEKFQYSSELIHHNIQDINLYLRVLPEWYYVNEMINLRFDGKAWKDIFNYSCQNSCFDVFRRNLGIISKVTEEFSANQFTEYEGEFNGFE